MHDGLYPKLSPIRSLPAGLKGLRDTQFAPPLFTMNFGIAGESQEAALDLILSTTLCSHFFFSLCPSSDLAGGPEWSLAVIRKGYPV